MFTSAQVCATVDISYRQLDYLCRTGAIPGRVLPGSGGRRRFSHDIVMRLAVARQLADAMWSRGYTSAFPDIVRAVMVGPEPPYDGFAVLYVDGTVEYRDRIGRDVDVGAVIVRFAVDEPVPCRAAS